jgi:hypothetical protein
MDANGHSAQSVFTVIAPVRHECVDELQALLDEMGANPAGNDILPLGRLPGLHYSSMSLFPERPGREPLLVFESNVDGCIADHLARVVEVAGDGIDRLWGSCVGYTAGDGLAWLRARVVLPGAYHVGNTGRSRAQIEAEAALRAAIEDHLDAELAAGTLPSTPQEIRDAVKAHLATQPEHTWALQPPTAATPAQMIERVAHIAKSSDRSFVTPLAAGGAAFLLLGRRSPARALLTLLAAAGGAAAWLRWRERTDPAEDAPIPDALLDAIEAGADRTGVAVNHLASLVDLKPGIGRRMLLRGILLVIDVAARIAFTKGELGGIPSIHYAHWSVVDGGRRLLFVSNYDGTWDSYLDDFIEKAASGLTAVWSNTRDFPPCRWLGIPHDCGGARHGPAFKRIARKSQVPTTVHFVAYPELSVGNIQRNTALRQGLVGELDEKGAQAWLNKL